METKITHKRHKPHDIPISKLGAGIPALITGPEVSSLYGELVIRRASHRSCYLASDPGHSLEDTGDWTVRPIDGPVSVTYQTDGTVATEEFDPVEPKPIPMSEMGTGFGIIVAQAGTGPDRIGNAVVCHAGEVPVFIDMTTGTRLMTAGSYTVRLIQPGESLTIEVVKDKPDDSVSGTEVVPAVIVGTHGQPEPDDNPDAPDETAATPESESADRRCSRCKHRSVPHALMPCSDDCFDTDDHKHFEAAAVDNANWAASGAEPPEPDDQFERLADGVTRMACGNCELHNPGPEICPRDDGNACLSPDPRGVNKFSHKLWTAPIEPETLDHALRHGDAVKMEALARATDSQYGWVFLEAVKAAHRESWSEHTHIGCSLLTNMFLSGNDDDALRRAIQDNTPISEMTAVFVELRDRLGLFKGDENAD